MTGLLANGSPYEVTANPDRPGQWGMVSGTGPALALLAGMEGQIVAPALQGPFLTLSGDEPKAILAALISNTTVTDVTGKAPDFGDAPPVALPN